MDRRHEIDLHAMVDGKTIKQVASFAYLGGTVYEDGGSGKVEGVTRRY